MHVGGSATNLPATRAAPKFVRAVPNLFDWLHCEALLFTPHRRLFAFVFSGNPGQTVSMAPVVMRAGVSSMMAKPVAGKVTVRASARAMPALGNFAKAAAPLIAKPQVRHVCAWSAPVETVRTVTIGNRDAFMGHYKSKTCIDHGATRQPSCSPSSP